MSIKNPWSNVQPNPQWPGGGPPQVSPNQPFQIDFGQFGAPQLTYEDQLARSQWRAQDLIAQQGGYMTDFNKFFGNRMSELGMDYQAANQQAGYHQNLTNSIDRRNRGNQYFGPNIARQSFRF